MPCCSNHNRLDLIRHSDDYQDSMCGTPRPMTGGMDALRTPGYIAPPTPQGEPDYCCFRCPVLHGVEPPPNPERLRRYE